MENPTLHRSTPGTIPVTYGSNSTLGFCEYLRTAQVSDKDPVRDRFLRLIQQPGLLEPQRCGPGNEPVGYRLLGAYDSVMMMLRAVKGLGQELAST